MKKLFFILISFLFLLGCTNTPEKQIEKSFYFQRGPSKRHQIKIQSVKIYDTIYVDEVYVKVDTLEKRIAHFEERIKRVEIFRDSIRKSISPDSIKQKFMRTGSERRMHFDRERDHFMNIQHYTRMLDMQRNGNIAAYYVEIVTNIDTMKFAVTPLTYYIICPVFMLE